MGSRLTRLIPLLFLVSCTPAQSQETELFVPVWKDASGKVASTLPYVMEGGKGVVHVDQNGYLWAISLETGEPFIPNENAYNYESDDCTGNAYLLEVPSSVTVISAVVLLPGVPFKLRDSSGFYVRQVSVQKVLINRNSYSYGTAETCIDISPSPPVEVFKISDFTYLESLQAPSGFTGPLHLEKVAASSLQ